MESVIVLAVLSSFLYLGGGIDLSLELFLWTLPAIIAFCAFTFMNLPLLRGDDGNLPDGLQTANKLTAIRIFLVPIVFILLARGWNSLGVMLYLVAVFTDIIDGHLARRLHQGSVLGVMLDPVGDILLTLALFLFLFLEGTVPFWLFALLILRYLQFFLGLAVLALLDVAPRLKATLAGKVVGVVQALGILVLLAGTLFRLPVPIEVFGTYIYVVLGTAFSSVIASQTVIGLRALTRK
jgi:CDP-diacylglycerol--glycerol-3-phosphate 3-phosphatidyltransferase